jgi:tetratricopeptide (TPR) repeat protein
MYESTIDGRSKRLGTNHPDTLRSRAALAIAYYAIGRTAEAISLYEKNLGTMREILGADHPNTLNAMINLASVFPADRANEAISLLENAMQSGRGALGDHHPYTIRAIHRLALAYFDAGRREEATALCEQTIPLLEESVNRPREELQLEAQRVVDDVISLSDAYIATGRVKDAVFLLCRCGFYEGALWVARRADHELMSTLLDKAIAEDVDHLQSKYDRLVVGELRLLAGKVQAAEAAIIASSALAEPDGAMHRSLGLVRLYQGKSDEAREEFRKALTVSGLRQPNGSFDLKKANFVDLSSAYFLDLVSADEFAAATKENKELACYPWFYIGQRRELEGNREAAIAAYKNSVELGDAETAEKTWAMSKWRLVELTKASADSP